jgi:hypothetical protein
MEIKYPIFYVDGGGVILFHSVGEIEQFLEPWAIRKSHGCLQLLNPNFSRKSK